MFTKIKESRIAAKDPTALAFDLFVHACQVAGAGDPLSNFSYFSYTESTHLAMQAMRKAVFLLSNSKRSERDAYEAYLQTRASWLGLDVSDRSDRVLARVGTMLSLFTQQEGTILFNAMSQINAEMRGRIARQFNAKKQEPMPRTPINMVAVLKNLINNPKLGETPEERISNAVKVGLPFLTRVLETHEQLLINHQIDPNIPLNFNRMATIAQTSPESLADAFLIDLQGNVLPETAQQKTPNQGKVQS
jgi:hypothetical protein